MRVQASAVPSQEVAARVSSRCAVMFATAFVLLTGQGTKLSLILKHNDGKIDIFLYYPVCLQRRAGACKQFSIFADSPFSATLPSPAAGTACFLPGERQNKSVWENQFQQDALSLEFVMAATVVSGFTVITVEGSCDMIVNGVLVQPWLKNVSNLFDTAIEDWLLL